MPPVDFTNVLQLLSLLLSGGALAAFLSYRHNMAKVELEKHSTDREADRVDFSTVLAEIRTQRDEAWQQIDKQETRMNQMEAEIQGLKLARDLDPFPHWIVDRNSEYVFVNREFERQLLEPLGRTYRDVIGKTHEDLGWPPEFCQKLKTLDAAARSRPDGRARMVASLIIEPLGALKVTVHKFPIRLKPADVVVGYAGYFTDIEPEAERIG